MRRVVHLAIMFVMAALLTALVAPMAHAAAPTVERFFPENEFNAGLSAQTSRICGFQVVATVSGTYAIISSTTTSGVERELQLQSLQFTFTNPETGESVTVRNAFQTTAQLTPISGNKAEGFLLRRGLNFLVVEQDGTQASAGRQELRANLTLDAQGNVIGAVVTLDDRTRNLTGLAAFLCPRLAA